MSIAAVEALREALARAFKYASGDAAREALEHKGYLEWDDYIKALGYALRRELTKNASPRGTQ